MKTVIDCLKNHRSVRNYQDQSIEPSIIQNIIECGQAASSSSFLQSYSIIEITDPKLRHIIAEIAGNQSYVVSAPCFFIFCADLKRAHHCCQSHQTAPTLGYVEQLITASLDVAIMAQNMAVAAEAQGLGICYIGGIRNNPQTLCQHLRIPKHVYPVFGMCIGYPATLEPKKPRLPMDLIFSTNTYPESPNTDLLRDYDQTMMDYYQSRTNNPKSQPWTQSVSQHFSKPVRSHMLDFLNKQGFNHR